VKRIPAVDAMRIVCAFVVFGLHIYGLPVRGLIERLIDWAPNYQQEFSSLLTLNHALFDGGAAVIVFFVISGICIHWPVRERDLGVGSYLVRRMVRVGLPLIICVVVARLAFGTTDFLDAVLWSLYCELIYYALYPILRVVALRTGWTVLLVASFAIAIALSTQPGDGSGLFFTYGHSKTWLLGLPTWLAGVWIAEHVSFTGAPLSRWALNLLRLSVWVIAALIAIWQFDRVIPMKWTLLAFVAPAGIWITYEIRNAHHFGVNRALEAAGAWSFSLYLCHKFAVALFIRWGISVGSPLGWTATLALGTFISLLFYRIAERPSHALARWLAKRTPPFLTIPARLASRSVDLNTEMRPLNEKILPDDPVVSGETSQ
jgi:peptidoglycan/LPS O-acetylase OafA/YrhL